MGNGGLGRVGKKTHMGISSHTHHGYNHRENDTAKGFSFPDTKEKKMVERITEVWKEKGYARWKRWKASNNRMYDCVEEFLDSPLFDGKTFWDIENEIEWVDE